MAAGRRQVSWDQARALVRAVRVLGRAVYATGVFAGATFDDVNRAADYCGFDVVQLSGGEAEGYCRMLERPVIRVLHVAPGSGAVALADEVEQAEVALRGRKLLHLLDTGGRGAAGGTGRTFDWSIAREVGVRHPVLVAGGLTAGNVGELVRLARPYGVDVSSGVEREGAKDPLLIRDFVAAVRRVEKEVEHAGVSVA